MRFVRVAYLWMRANPVTLTLLVAAAAVAISINAERRNDDQGRDITKIQKTPCNENPDGKKCADLRLKVAKAEPLRNPCTSYQRVTSRRGKNCERFYVVPGRELQANSKSVQDLETGSEGEAAPAQGGSGGESVPGLTAGEGQPTNDGKGAGRNPPGPHDPGSGTPADPVQSPVATAPAGSSVEQPVGGGGASEGGSETAATNPSVLEAAGSTVGEVVTGTGKVVEATTCGLTAPLLCPKR